MRVRRSSIGGDRGCGGGSPYCFVLGLPARIGQPPLSGQSVRVLAHRCSPPYPIAEGPPCDSYRGGGRPATDAAAGTTVVRTGLGTGGTWDRFQAACDRQGTAQGEHAGTPRSRSCISSTASYGSTTASCSRATTITVRRARVMPAFGARPAAPASLSPVPKIPSAERLRIM